MFHVNEGMGKNPTFEQISQACALLMVKQVVEKPDTSFCLATGGSPLEAYRIFVKMVIAQHVDISKVVFIKLDEWDGLAMSNPATCDYFLQKELYQPLNVQPEQIISFNSMSSNPAAEAKRIAALVEKRTPIDVSILGIGRNGHLGLNEPAPILQPHAHVANIAALTAEHAMLRENNETVTRGLTLGMVDLIKSRHVVMMVTGTGKEEAFEGMCQDGISTENPSTFLKLATKVTVLSCIG